MIRRLAPFLQWLPELRKPEVLRADLIAGVTVATILVPQSMAYARLAGLPAVYGLYAAFLPLFGFLSTALAPAVIFYLGACLCALAGLVLHRVALGRPADDLPPPPSPPPDRSRPS